MLLFWNFFTYLEVQTMKTDEDPRKNSRGATGFQPQLNMMATQGMNYQMAQELNNNK